VSTAADPRTWDERVRAEVATWPPLTREQRDRLRALLDLSDGDGDETTP
jgi:hypothetical protein